MPKGVYVRKPRRPKEYDAALVARVRELYDQGKTQVEIAQETGTTQRVIWRLMQHHGLKARVAAKRDQRGERNSSWRGDEVTYAAFHYRMKALRGSPQRCEECGTTDPDKQYDWANLTGRYEDPDDYRRMCRGCHWVFDQKHLNFKGATGGRPARKERA